MEQEAAHQKISVLVHSAVAVFSGYLSLIIQHSGRALFGAIAGIAILVVSGLVSWALLKKPLTSKAGLKWWFSNGMIIYLFVWIAAWVVFFNMGF
jgi:predicted histidine transporter YuiF (NhaC family)